MSDISFTHLPRIRVGEHFARRDEFGTLVETGWIDDEGVEHRDKEMTTGRDKIDATNPAAFVPTTQEWK